VKLIYLFINVVKLETWIKESKIRRINETIAENLRTAKLIKRRELKSSIYPLELKEKRAIRNKRIKKAKWNDDKKFQYLFMLNQLIKDHANSWRICDRFKII